MRIYKSIKEGKVSNHYDLKKATLIRVLTPTQQSEVVKISEAYIQPTHLTKQADLLSYRNVSQ